MSIGTKIKKLRRDHDMTQEQLAEYLGITANAVSQWERDRTAPDISQLPILANLFDVTTDYILGVDVSQKQAAIEQLREEAWQLCNAGDKRGATQIMRQALSKYPNSYQMMCDLAVFLYQCAFQQDCTQVEFLSFCTEAAVSVDKIIDGCNDMKILGTVMELACSIYPAIGRYDEALRLVSDIPDISKNEMLTVLYSGDKRITHIKDIICESVSAAADHTIWLASQNKADGSPLFDGNSRIMLYEKAITFYKTLYEAGDFFFDAESLAFAEKHLANIYASRQDTENTLLHLEECVRYTMIFDTYDETKEIYTSIIPRSRVLVGINRNNRWNTSHEMLMRLCEDENFDFIRDNTAFTALIEQLKQTDNIQ